MPRNIISSDDALIQLNKWKSGSTKVFIYSANCGVTVWSVATVEHVSAAELHFGTEGVDDKDFRFIVNCHSAEFALLEVKELTSLFFSPRRDFRDFGTILEIVLRGDTPGEIKARVVLAELFRSKFIDIVNPPQSGR